MRAKSDAWLVSASAWALGLSAGSSSRAKGLKSLLGQLAKRIGLPALRTATRQAMRVMGNHFVLGQTILEAQKRAASGEGRMYRYSFDMLGEGARTAEDAARYFRSYADCHRCRHRHPCGNSRCRHRPGISVETLRAASAL